MGAHIIAAARRTAAGLLALAIAACTPLGLNTASVDVERAGPATPPLMAAFGGDPPVANLDDWARRRVVLQRAFERDVYGPVPVELKAREVSRRVVDPAYAGGRGVLEEIDVRIGSEDANAPGFRIALAIPANAGVEAPAPVILTGNFCGNPGSLGSGLLSPPRAAGACDGDGLMGRVARLIFGMHIIESPTAEILDRGYAYAAVFPSEIVADGGGPEQARRDLEAFASLLPEDRRPNAAIAVWAAAFGWMNDVLDEDPRLDASRTAAYGHSRHGKAALLAGAFDTRIEAVLSHQSGKGGATLTRSHAGESVKQITRSYPHWFAPAYAAWADNEQGAPVDQHQLIALIAPRHVLLGNGWKDVWSDPNGAFRAAAGADAAWRMYGARGLAQASMRDGSDGGRIDYHIRVGGHGVRKADWAYFLDYLDRVFAQPVSD